MLVMTRNITGAACTSAVGIEGLMHCFQDGRVAAHAEVVVAAPCGDELVGGIEMRLREILGETIDVVEVAVGLVLVFLVELRLVEALVVEFATAAARRSRCNVGGAGDARGSRGRHAVGDFGGFEGSSTVGTDSYIPYQLVLPIASQLMPRGESNLYPSRCQEHQPSSAAFRYSPPRRSSSGSPGFPQAC